MYPLNGINVAVSSFLLDNFLKASQKGKEKRIGALGRIVSRRREWREGLDTLQSLLRSGHPFAEFIERLNTELSPRARKKLISNLLVRGWLLNEKRRLAFKKREGFFPPYVVSLAPTSRCNLSCEHCSAAGRESEDIELDLLVRIMNEARDEMGVNYFILTGGEPFCYPEFFSIIESFPDCYFQIFSNGTLLDEEKVSRLAELGNALVMVSLEGLEKPTDERREEGTFGLVIDSMKRLRKARLPFGFSVMLTSENCEAANSESFVDWALEQGCLIGYFFQYMPVGPEPNFGLVPSPRQRDASRRSTYRLRNEKPIFLIDPINDGPITGGCTSAGRHYVHVLSSGDVVPCVYNNFSTHNIKNSTLTEALKGPYLSTLRNAIPFEGNSLRCCMLLDRPAFFFKALEIHKPRSNISGEEEKLLALKDDLMEYSNEMREIYDDAWKHDDWQSVIRSIKWVVGS